MWNEIKIHQKAVTEIGKEVAGSDFKSDSQQLYIGKGIFFGD